MTTKNTIHSDIQWRYENPKRRARLRLCTDHEYFNVPEKSPYSPDYIAATGLVLVVFGDVKPIAFEALLPSAADRSLFNFGETSEDLTNQIIQRSQNLATWGITIAHRSDGTRTSNSGGSGSHGGNGGNAASHLDTVDRLARRIQAYSALLVFCAGLALHDNARREDVIAIAEKHGLDMEIQET